MEKQYKQAYRALKVMGVPVFTNADNDRLGNFFISAEAPGSTDWVDYYDAPDDWIFGVNPTIETVLQSFGLYPEWVNPGLLGVYES